MAKKARLQRRAWLNPADRTDTSSIATEVGGGSGWIGGEVIIRDFSDKLYLGFDFENKKGARRSLNRADLLVDELIQFRDVLYQAAVEAGYIKS